MSGREAKFIDAPSAAIYKLASIAPDFVLIFI